MPDEFETVAMSKFGKMPVVLLIDNRHRNITDEQFEKARDFIRQLVDGNKRVFYCSDTFLNRCETRGVGRICRLNGLCHAQTTLKPS